MEWHLSWQSPAPWIPDQDLTQIKHWALLYACIPGKIIWCSGETQKIVCKQKVPGEKQRSSLCNDKCRILDWIKIESVSETARTRTGPNPIKTFNILACSIRIARNHICCWAAYIKKTSIAKRNNNTGKPICKVFTIRSVSHIKIFATGFWSFKKSNRPQTLFFYIW